MINQRSTVLLVISWTLLTMACVNIKPTPSIEPVVLGSVYSLSGYKSDMGNPSAKGARLAADRINATGGINGRPLRLILADGQSNPAASGQAVEDIISSNPDIIALIGLSDTDLVRPAAAAAARHGRLFLTSGATSPLLPAEFPEYLFLACFGDNAQAAAAAEWVFQVKGMRTINVIYDATETYTTLLQKYFADSFTELGGQVLAVRQYDPADMRRLAEGLTPSDGVFLATGSVDDALSGIQFLRRAGVTGPIVGGDSFDSESFWESHPEVKDVYYTTHTYLGADNPDPHVQRFSAAYHTAYGGNTPDAFAALSYDSVNLIAAAIRHAESISPEDVRRALAATADFKGITGNISFSGGRRIPDKSVTIMEIGSGMRRFVTTFVPKVVSDP